MSDSFIELFVLFLWNSSVNTCRSKNGFINSYASKYDYKIDYFKRFSSDRLTTLPLLKLDPSRLPWRRCEMIRPVKCQEVVRAGVLPNVIT